MNPKVVEVFKLFIEGTIDRAAALEKLVELGFDRADCESLLFTAAGGSDVVEEGEDGKAYFVAGDRRTLRGPDGWPVKEVAP